MNKIYILPVSDGLQPQDIPIIYPSHNKGFMESEEAFLLFLNNHPELLTDDAQKADWHYLPVYWDRWLTTSINVKKNFEKEGSDRLQQEVNKCIIDDKKTFTVYHYDHLKIDLGRTVVFQASRLSKQGFDIPVLCALHSIPFPLPKKKYLASFVGKIKTNPIRAEMQELLKDRTDTHIVRSQGRDYFVQTILESFVVLSPRGFGSSSFRFFEAMQLGVVPFLIGDIDHRPFKKFLDWDSVSLYTPDLSDINHKLDQLDKNQLLKMGVAAKRMYEEKLAHQNWCKYVIKELEDLR